MDETQFLYNSWKTSLELASDRGYVVNDNYNNITSKEFKYMLSNRTNKDSNIDIICNEHHDEPNKVLYIKYILALKIKPSSIKEVYEEIKEKNQDNKNIDLILILKTKPNNSILKLQKDKQYSNIQIYWCKQLQFNVTKHELVPVHRRLSEDEGNSILTRYSLTAKNQLPVLLKDDIVSKYYNFKSGDVIEITQTKTSQNSEYKFYRCVR
tara:strand:+ start:89 stop:718 length:630 start_codon:yes stop_codon:yes gene_type:complete